MSGTILMPMRAHAVSLMMLAACFLLLASMAFTATDGRYHIFS